MGKVLIFCAGGQGAQEGIQLDTALEEQHNGKEVLLISCDESICFCNDNCDFDRRRCRICMKFQNKNYKKYLNPNIERRSISEFINDTCPKQSVISFDYNDAVSLKKIKYHGVEIGMGAISTYISFTRNLNPKITNDSKKYFDKVLYSQVLMTHAVENICSRYNIEKVIIHNGRFSIFKPFLNYSQINNIPYTCTEIKLDKNGLATKDYYENDIPHNIMPQQIKYDKYWDEKEKEGYDVFNIGKGFFERRRNAQGTGDKIYTKDQNPDLEIEGWDNSKENIVIFNSSEDEFCAISEDFEKGKFFDSQIQGIKKIVEHYLDDDSKRFYLKVHPNLREITYKYHTYLYDMNYPNLIVFDADSPISSYKLLDKCDKVITFGSTMGIEATYAKKPSICLGPAYYDYLGVVYKPKDENELWNLINDRNLKHLFNTNLFKYGFYEMGIFDSIIGEKFKYIDVRMETYDIGNKPRISYAINQIFGSKRVYVVFRGILNLYCKLFRNKNMEMPLDEDEDLSVK